MGEWRTILLLLVLLPIGSGCERKRETVSEEAPPSATQLDAAEVVQVEAVEPAPVVPSEPCIPRAHTNLSGTHISFPVGTRCAYSLEEVREGIEIPYLTVVSDAHEVVSTPQDAGRCQAPGPSGLSVFVEIGDGLGNRWCICDEGLCGYRDREVALKLGTYTHAVEWNGVNWTGPSDTERPPGEPFGPGRYTVTISAVGTVPSEKGRAFRVEAELPILLTDGEPPAWVTSQAAGTARAPIDRWGVATAPGLKTSNEDRYLLAPDLGVIAVADGSSKRSRGDFVAQHTIDVLRSELVQGRRDLSAALSRANGEAHATGDIDLRSRRMGASVAVVATTEDPARVDIAHVGTSRVYRWRKGKLSLLTRDHLLSDALINSGEMAAEDLETFPYKEIASRAVGARREVVVDTQTVEVEPGDVFLVMTAGLYRTLEDPEIARIVGSNDDLQGVAHNLMNSAKLAGGNDNMTVVLFRIRT